MSETMHSVGTVPNWTLGWRMRRALAHADVSVQTMADELGVSRGTLSRWLNDTGAPPRSAFVKMWALRTGVPYDWLTTGQADSGSRTTSRLTPRQRLARKQGAARARERRLVRNVIKDLDRLPCVP